MPPNQRKDRKTESSVVVARVQAMIREGEARKKDRPTAVPVAMRVNRDTIENVPTHSEIMASREARWRDEASPSGPALVVPRRRWRTGLAAGVLAAIGVLGTGIGLFAARDDDTPSRKPSSSIALDDTDAASESARVATPVSTESNTVPVSTANSGTDSSTMSRSNSSVSDTSKGARKAGTKRAMSRLSDLATAGDGVVVRSKDKRAPRRHRRRRSRTKTDVQLSSLLDSL